MKTAPFYKTSSFFQFRNCQPARSYSDRSLYCSNCDLRLVKLAGRKHARFFCLSCLSPPSPWMWIVVWVGHWQAVVGPGIHGHHVRICSGSLTIICMLKPRATLKSGVGGRHAALWWGCDIRLPRSKWCKASMNTWAWRHTGNPLFPIIRWLRECFPASSWYYISNNGFLNVLGAKSIIH